MVSHVNDLVYQSRTIKTLFDGLIEGFIDIVKRWGGRYLLKNSEV